MPAQTRSAALSLLRLSGSSPCVRGNTTQLFLSQGFGHRGRSQPQRLLRWQERPSRARDEGQERGERRFLLRAAAARGETRTCCRATPGAARWMCWRQRVRAGSRRGCRPGTRGCSLRETNGVRAAWARGSVRGARSRHVLNWLSGSVSDASAPKPVRPTRLVAAPSGMDGTDN